VPTGPVVIGIDETIERRGNMRWKEWVGDKL
jgi:hypothetical protein